MSTWNRPSSRSQSTGSDSLWASSWTRTSPRRWRRVANPVLPLCGEPRTVRTEPSRKGSHMTRSPKASMPMGTRPAEVLVPNDASPSLAGRSRPRQRGANPSRRCSPSGDSHPPMLTVSVSGSDESFRAASPGPNCTSAPSPLEVCTHGPRMTARRSGQLPANRCRLSPKLVPSSPTSGGKMI